LISSTALEALSVWRKDKRGRKPTLPLAQLLQGLLFHFLFSAGTLAEHLRQLTGEQMAESTLAQRRAALGWPMFVEWLRQALRPLAQCKLQPEAFWRGWRLVAWDGTQYSLTNTPQTLARLPKAKARRRKAAWAKITAVVLLELGLHNPLAAAVGWQGESEYTLTRGLISALPSQSLLLADRLSGVTALLAEILTACQTLGSHFLIRTRKNLLVQKRQRLADGSALIWVEVRDPQRPRKIVRILKLREICVRVSRRGIRPEVIRLWTSLLDPHTAPALELAQLYAQRWEQELYWRQMKLELRKSDVLQSHTPETAAQEIMMLVLATALLAHERARVASGHVPVLKVSFLKCLELLRPLWLILALARDVLDPTARQQLGRAVDREIRRCLKPKRRARSCPRAVRQPVKGWPRLLTPKYTRGDWHYEITHIHRRK
jgi:plasmid stabilization system protein ParE